MSISYPPLNPLDPVFCDPNTERWYFWTDPGVNSEGPFPCESVARHHFAVYCQSRQAVAAP